MNINKFLFLFLVLSLGTLSACTKPGEAGFTPLFNGQTLDSWVGDDGYWSVKDGAILGQTTDSTAIWQNRYLIYQGPIPPDFELKAEYRISQWGNSGINYRSTRVEGVDYHALRGYQFDFNGPKNYVGNNYEELHRTTLAQTGQSVVLLPVAPNQPLGAIDNNQWTARELKESLGHPDELRKHIKDNDWNQLHLIARGNHLQHYVNGVLMTEIIDQDTVNRRMDGLLGIQLHRGAAMMVEVRNIRIR